MFSQKIITNHPDTIHSNIIQLMWKKVSMAFNLSVPVVLSRETITGKESRINGKVKKTSEWWFNAVSATEAIFTARTC